MENSKTLPILALRGKTVFPYTMIYFDVARRKSILAIEEAMSNNQEIFLVSQKDSEKDNPTLRDLYEVGTVATIKQIVKLPKGLVRVLAEGRKRAYLDEMYEIEPSFRGEVVDMEEEQLGDEFEEEALIKILKDTVKLYVRDAVHIDKNFLKEILDLEKLVYLIDEIASNLPIGEEEKQKVLEERNIRQRCEILLTAMDKDIQIFQIRKEIQGKVKEAVDKNQREYYLREQMKIISSELGDDSTLSEGNRMRERAAKLKASKEVVEKLEMEIRRFENTPATVGESGMLRNYIELVLDMPWKKSSKDNRDLKRAFTILEEDHYGLKKIKERILEFLAVRSLVKKVDAPIICLVGPPGVGKTSIAKSVARATNKKYVRISLGGVKDEAEIRGHRRTYIGAMPGRIVEALKQAKVRNPLILLDEIDKVGSDYKGDTASALLEVLDGEQNVAFRDHYLELPLDLSEVFFIATANDVSTIPKPLLDRMEFIEMSSYTENEKYHIARQYLVEKQKKKNGISETALEITDDAIYELIHHYTREAGVRGLERKIGDLCRKTARKILEGEVSQKFILDKDRVKQMLGLELFEQNEIDLSDEVGIVKGLAWTSVGGDTLSIEVNIMPGKGMLELTGSLGDVMKESAKTGLSYIRSVGGEYQIEPEFFEKHDIHIHIPEGAVPKDGPSAGITMATAMLSAILKRAVRGNVAMTGEVTLRGKVLPIGGLKEKLLAAKTAGMKEVLVPERNKRMVEEIDTEIKDGMIITYVKTMKEVIERAFVCTS